MRNEYTDIICDLETLGTREDAVILTLALVKLNADEQDSYDTLEDPDRYFYAVLDAQEQIDVWRRSVTFDTFKWWTQQDREPTQAAFLTGRQPVEKTLREMVKWIGKGTVLWGNGENFDNIILESLLQDCGIQSPWAFWEHRDLRTMQDMNYRMTGEKKPNIPKGVAHHALDDAKYEALCLQHYFNNIHGN